MFHRPFSRVLSLFALVLTLSLSSAPVQAVPSLRYRNPEAPRAVQQVQQERGFFSFLMRLFGKSRGGMDPNGGTAGTAPGEE